MIRTVFLGVGLFALAQPALASGEGMRLPGAAQPLEFSAAQKRSRSAASHKARSKHARAATARGASVGLLGLIRADATNEPVAAPRRAPAGTPGPAPIPEVTWGSGIAAISPNELIAPARSKKATPAPEVEASAPAVPIAAKPTTVTAIKSAPPKGSFGADIDALIARHAQANGLPESLVRQVVMRESRGNARVVSAGNYGLMQIRLGTARGLGYRGSAQGLLDPETNLTYAVRYLAGAYKVAGGNHSRAISYYQRGYYYAAKGQRAREASAQAQR
jgi:soluble lytic murein transglycosylase-like protein